MGDSRLCWYHQRFGEQSRACAEPCQWLKIKHTLLKPQQQQGQSDICWYHTNYGTRARACIQPCKYNIPPVRQQQTFRPARGARGRGGFRGRAQPFQYNTQYQQNRIQQPNNTNAPTNNNNTNQNINTLNNPRFEQKAPECNNLNM